MPKQQFHFYSVGDRVCNACMKWKWKEKAHAFTGNLLVLSPFRKGSGNETRSEVHWACTEGPLLFLLCWGPCSMSSANMRRARLNSPHSLLYLLNYMPLTKKVGESRQPRLTPEVTGIGLEMVSLILTKYSVFRDFSRSRNFPPIP